MDALELRWLRACGHDRFQTVMLATFAMWDARQWLLRLWLWLAEQEPRVGPFGGCRCNSCAVPACMAQPSHACITCRHTFTTTARFGCYDPVVADVSPVQNICRVIPVSRSSLSPGLGPRPRRALDHFDCFAVRSTGVLYGVLSQGWAAPCHHQRMSVRLCRMVALAQLGSYHGLWHDQHMPKRVPERCQRP